MLQLLCSNAACACACPATFFAAVRAVPAAFDRKPESSLMHTVHHKCMSFNSHRTRKIFQLRNNNDPEARHKPSVAEFFPGIAYRYLIGGDR
jgi:hypothetical protein